jgi:AcrR family transcriptional regulator
MARRLTPRGKERRAQLMEYATARFAEQGYHPTSVSEIVAGLGVGKGVFYWYFESKEQLLLEILRDAQTDLRRTQRDAIADEPDPIRRIAEGIRASMSWTAEHPALNTLLRFAATEERFLPALRKGEEVAARDIAVHLDEAIAEGRIPDADTDMLAHAMLGATSRLARTFIHDHGRDPAEVAETCVTFCLEGLLGERAPGPTPVPSPAADAAGSSRAS